MKKLLLLSIILFTLLSSGCDPTQPVVHIENRLPFPVRIYSKSGNIPWVGFFYCDKETGEYFDPPSYSEYTPLLLEVNETTEFMFRGHQTGTRDEVMAFLTVEDENDVFDFYIENALTGEIILTKDSLKNNPIVKLRDEGRKETIWPSGAEYEVWTVVLQYEETSTQ